MVRTKKVPRLGEHTALTCDEEEDGVRLFITGRLDSAVYRAICETPGLEVSRWEGPGPIPRALLLERAAEQDALITMLTDQVDEELCAHAPHLRIVANMAVGYDNLDLAALSRHGVYATNTPEVLTDATAELTVGLILALLRGIALHADAMRRGQWHGWSPDGFLGTDVAGKVLGIVGLGRIGRAVAQRAAALGMEVVALAPRHERPAFAGQYLSLPNLIEAADVISLHLPANDTTRRFCDAAFFAAMKPNSYFVNTARGSLVDTPALIAGLVSGHLAGAALDVYETEPLPMSHPLFACPNVILTPHIGSATVETRRRMALRAWENVDRVRTGGVPRDLLNPDVVRS